MNNVCALFFDLIASINWFEAIKAFAAITMALIAFLALKNWKRQDKAKREAEFLDSLIEAAYAYIAQMPTPITYIAIAKIGMASYIPTREGGGQVVKGAIAYIEKNGERDAKRLRETLEAIRPSATRLNLLATKGLVFTFNDYAKCQNAIEMLLHQFGRMEAFMIIIGSSSMNWENPEVLKNLNDIMALDPDDIQKVLANNNAIILEFATETYKRIYGKVKNRFAL